MKITLGDFPELASDLERLKPEERQQALSTSSSAVASTGHSYVPNVSCAD